MAPHTSAFLPAPASLPAAAAAVPAGLTAAPAAGCRRICASPPGGRDHRPARAPRRGGGGAAAAARMGPDGAPDGGGMGAASASDAGSTATAAAAAAAATATPAPDDAAVAPVPGRAGRIKVRRGWSNTTGAVIRRVCEDVWVVERAYDWLSIDVGGKSTVIRLPDGTLFVHSPLLLTSSLKRSLDALGPVSVIVISNTEHVDCAAQWVTAYPAAVSLGPPGYAARSGVPLTGDIPADNTPHPAFQGVIQHTFISSMPLFSESVFFHTPSGTLMATDLYWSWPPGAPLRTRAFAAGMDWVYKPVYTALLVRDKTRWAEEMGRVLAWGGTRIIPCHGLVEEGVDVPAVLRAHYASLLRE